MSDERTRLLAYATEKVTGKIDNYDTPERSFANIAELWEWWLGGQVNLDSKDVAGMMLLLKMVRLRTDRYHYDSLVDLAGYAACYAEVLAEDDPLGTVQ